MTNYEKIKRQIANGTMNDTYEILCEPTCQHCAYHSEEPIEYLDRGVKKTSHCKGIANDIDCHCRDGVLKWLQQEAPKRRQSNDN